MKTYEHLTLYLESDRLVLNNMRKDIQEKLKGMPELLSIGQVAEIFSIHQDTLRNWEKEGTLVPLRVGPRKDRKYRPQDIQAIVDKMGSKLTLPQLEAFLWKSADILRGKIDSSDYKKYIFGLLFYKRMSDVWDEEYESVMKEYNDKTIAGADYNHRFQVPKDCKWAVVTEQAESIGQKLNDIFEKLANANSPKLDRIFDDLDFSNRDRFPNETLQRLINHFSQYNFGNTYISSDLLGDAYEYLIKQFAADAGKKGGEFYTPREVEKVIIGILKPHQKDHIYDPTAGSVGFLLEAYDYLKQKSGEKIAKTLYLYGQELNISTFAIAKINMFLHGLDSADIRRGDTLANPQFLTQNGNLQTFDIAVANPPYSIKDWESEIFRTNKYGRLEGYDMPPEKNADFAFVLHIIKSMNVNGRAGIVLPNGVLSRSGAEARIREQILKNDLIEAVIALPAKLFYGTGIPAVILILNKNKSESRKNKVLIIDAGNDYLEGKNQNSLRKQDVDKIIKTFDNYSSVNKYANVVDFKEIESNDFSLNICQYVDDSQEDIVIDTNELKLEIKKVESQIVQINNHIETSFKNIVVNSKNSSLVKSKIGDIPEGWSVEVAENLFEFINGYAFYKDGYSNDGVRVIDLLNITRQGEFQLTEKDKFVSNEIYLKHPKQHLIKDDLIIIMTDITPGKELLGKTAIIDKSGEYILNQRVGCLRKKSDKIHIPFARYIINSPLIHKFFVSKALGSAQFYVNTSTITKMLIPLPSIEEQEKIAKILSLMDKKALELQGLIEITNTLKKGLIQDLLSGKARTK